MSKCGKCSKFTAGSLDLPKCRACGKTFHFSCGNVKEDAWKKLNVKQQTDWKCPQPNCKETQVRNDPHAEQSLDWRALINAIQDPDLKIIFGYLIKKMENIEQGANFLSAKYDETLEKTQELEKKVTELMKEKMELEKNIQNIKQQTINLEQYGRRRNIEVFGLETTPNEDVYELVEKVAKIYDSNFQKDEIEFAHRLPTKNTQRPPSIIAVMKSRKKREELLERAQTKRKEAKIKQAEIYPKCKGKDNTVYIKENLSAFFKKLLWKTRSKADELNYKYVSYENCKVIVKKNKGDPKITILSEKDIDLLI